MTITDITGREYKVTTLFADVDGKSITLSNDALDLLFSTEPTVIDDIAETAIPDLHDEEGE